MKIESLNIWGGKVYEPLMEHMKRQADEIDIFCLQEVFDDAHVDQSRVMSDAVMDIYGQLVDILPEHRGYFAPSQDDEEGIAMFVRKVVPVKESGDVFVYRWKNAMIDNDARTLGRNLQYVDVEHNGRDITIMNFHGLWNGLGKADTPDKITQSQNIQQFMQGKRSQKILVGDFNLLPDTKSLEIVGRGMRDLVKEYGVISTRSELYEKPVKHANYVFVSPEITVVDFSVLPDVVSDHAPLVVEIA